MTAGLGESTRDRRLGDVLLALAGQEGSAAHAYAMRELAGSGQTHPRDLADAVHLVAMLHAQRPGILEIASERLRESPAEEWIAQASHAFSAERAFITRLVVAAGPLPSTPGQAGTETAVVTQRGALEMLARSERLGCPLGAAIGLLLDWPAIRTVLMVAAQRFGVASAASALPDPQAMLAMVESFGADPRARRAICFGAEQVFAQHRALWDLLETRCSARG